jgi:hypothetical protein
MPPFHEKHNDQVTGILSLVPFGQVVPEEKIKPEALKSLYRSPGNKKKQPWVCPFQNCVRQPHPPFQMAAVFKGNDYLPLKFASVSFYCQVSNFEKNMLPWQP